MRTRLFASLVVVSFLVSLGSAAQERGSLSGVVVDAQGAVLPGVTVLIEGPERRGTVTDERGAFVFTALVPADLSAPIAGLVADGQNRACDAALSTVLA